MSFESRFCYRDKSEVVNPARDSNFVDNIILCLGNLIEENLELSQFNNTFNPISRRLFSEPFHVGRAGHKTIHINLIIFVITLFKFRHSSSVVARCLCMPKVPGSNPGTGNFFSFFAKFLQIRFFQVSDKLQKL